MLYVSFIGYNSPRRSLRHFLVFRLCSRAGCSINQQTVFATTCWFVGSIRALRLFVCEVISQTNTVGVLA
jgi:hypothetical protein